MSGIFNQPTQTVSGVVAKTVGRPGILGCRKIVGKKSSCHFRKMCKQM